MKNIICPNCKGELLISSTLRSHEIEEEELIPVIEKALCENCKRVFDVHFKVGDVIDVGSQDDFYLYRDDEEDDDLGDMYVEKDGYALTHKAFNTIEEFLYHFENGSIEDICSDDKDVCEILTVVNTDDREQYAASFEVVGFDNSSFVISIYLADQVGLISIISFDVNIENYSSMDEIEKACVEKLKGFKELVEDDPEDEKEEKNESDNNTFTKIEIKCPICGGDLSYEECTFGDIYDETALLEDLICKNCNKIFEVDFIPIGIYETGDIEVEDDREELED